MNPEELLYTETHEWVHVSEDGGGKIATVGITDFAVQQLTDLVYLQLPEVGMTVSASGEFGEVESVKAVSSLYAPVDGEIIEVNSSLPESLEKLNEDPYNAGWMIRIRITDESGLAKLLDHAAYQKQIAEEG